MQPTTGLLTDHYELTMLEAALADGSAKFDAKFEVFARAIPATRSFGVVAGTDRVLTAIENFRFGPTELEFLQSHNIVNSSTLDYLATYHFSGSIRGIPEGGLFFGNTPIVEISGTFAECLILETILLSIFNFDSAVASAAARMVIAAGSRTIVEMGSRRTHESAAVSSARAAYLVGASATSNLEAGRVYGIPTTGTVAHAFILAHRCEADAFKAQLATQGKNTTYLVDTYDIEVAIKLAVEIVGPELGAIRIDSGDPELESKRARSLLDSLGATETKIVLSGDLDEYRIDSLSQHPIDSFGVGSRLVTGSGYPTCSFVYKLVEIGESGNLRGVAKLSSEKSTIAGAKNPVRGYDSANRLRVEILGLGAGQNLAPEDFDLDKITDAHVTMMEKGLRIHRPSLVESRQFHKDQLGVLPKEFLELRGKPPVMGSLLIKTDNSFTTLA